MMDQELIVSLDSSNHEFLFELAKMQYQIALNGRPSFYKASLKNLTKNLESQEAHIPTLLLRGELYFLYGKHINNQDSILSYRFAIKILTKGYL